MSRRLLFLLTLVLALGPAARAQAGWYPSTAIDGPNADVQSVANVDVDRDGNGAVAYIRNDGGVPHAFISRLVNGSWRPPERVDTATPDAVTDLKVAAGDGYRLAVAWITDGNVYGAVSLGGTSPTPFQNAAQIGGPDAASLDLDMGINGAAYAVWTQDGDVRGARLQDSIWAPIGPVDINPAEDAGSGAGRPKVAVAADGNAVVVWGEAMTDGRSHVWSRRLTGTTLSTFPQDLTFGDGSADSPDISIQWDSSFAWTVFRQTTAGIPHSYGRRLVGSQYNPPQEIDGAPVSLSPRVAVGGAGDGGAVAEGEDGSITSSTLDHDAFTPMVGLGSASGPLPSPDITASDRGDIGVAWSSQGADGTIAAHGRLRASGENWGGDTVISNPGYGSVTPGVSISGDRVGDEVVAMTQGPDGSKALTVGEYDRPPGAPFIDSTQAYKRQTRPELRWRPGLELWGAQTYRVLMDGVQIGQTQNSTLVPQVPLTTGTHTWQVEAVDEKGQTARSRARTLKIDSTPPAVKISIAGKRSANQALKITVRATDSGGSGLDHITLDLGDHSALTHDTHVTHRFKRGTYTLKVAATDKAGNVTRATAKLKIKKK